MIKVLVVEPAKNPYVKQINGELKDMQSIVGGYIERIQLTPNIDLWCNEEGKIQELPDNRQVGYDVIAGTFFIAKGDENGDLKSLSEKEIAQFTDYFSL